MKVNTQQDESGLSRGQLLGRISSMLDAEPPYISLFFTKPELAVILSQLEGYKRPKAIALEGERPAKQRAPCEADTQYRKRMSAYIELNTDIKIEGLSYIMARFYDDVADFLGL